jgi:hypothetical protein
MLLNVLTGLRIVEVKIVAWYTRKVEYLPFAEVARAREFLTVAAGSPATQTYRAVGRVLMSAVTSRQRHPSP